MAPIQTQLSSNRLLAVFAVLFVGMWNVMAQVAGTWTAEAYSAMTWAANVLVFGTMAIALVRL